jgi:hypothetical protein
MPAARRNLATQHLVESAEDCFVWRSYRRRTQPEAGGLDSASLPEGLPRELSEPAAVRVQHAEVVKVPQTVVCGCQQRTIMQIVALRRSSWRGEGGHR